MIHRVCLLNLIAGLLAGVLILNGDRALAAETCARQAPFVIAPMVAGIGLRELSDPSGKKLKLAPGYNSLGALNQLLDELGPRGGNGRVEVGYTVGLPLLDFFRREPGADGLWRFDHQRLAFYLDLIRKTPRPVVVYLFANHFAPKGPLSEELQRDRRNLMSKSNGELPLSKYFSTPVLPFTLSANDQVPVNIYRFRAIREVLSALKNLEPAARSRVIAVTLGGEAHHLFDDLMGATGNFASANYTDYSELAVAEFRTWLQARYGNLTAMNAALGTGFSAWDAVTPPSRDIRKEKLKGFWEHFDAYAGGYAPIYGWVDPKAGVQAIRVELDQKPVGEAVLGINRMDVYEQLPDVLDPNSGFRYDLDLAKLAPGIHRVDMIARLADGKEYSLGERDIVLMEGNQRPPSPVWISLQARFLSLFKPRRAPFSGRAWLDQPRNMQDYYYNPYAVAWQQFREYQVRQYVGKLYGVAASTGFDKQRLFSHQLLPDLNGGWNDLQFASRDFFSRDMPFQPGLTLYGGLTISDQAVSKAFGRPYGVPEMHPLLNKSPAEPLAALEFQRDHCAVFVTPYFMGIVPKHLSAGADGHEAMLISPDNLSRGSAGFYHAIRQMAAPTQKLKPN